MTGAIVSESIQHIQMVIKESAKNGERLVNLKERLMTRNTKEQLLFDQLKNSKKRSQED